MINNRINIIKVGGAVVEDKERLNTLLSSFTQLEGKKILVHGGGRAATRIAERLQIETKMVEGRRITDEAMLEVVTMVYGGLVSKNIVAELQARGINATGLAGCDMNIIESVKRPVKDVDYGFVGDVKQVNTAPLSMLIDNNIVPVIAPLTHDHQGTILNTNADTIAATVAKALAKNYDVTLTYCFEMPGVMKDPDDSTSVIPSINKSSYSKLKEQGIISGGMIPKLDNAFDALEQGVSRVIITSFADIAATNGTTITR